MAKYRFAQITLLKTAFLTPYADVPTAKFKFS